MHRWHCITLVGTAALLGGLAVAAEPDPRAQKKIESLEKLLPQYEKAADEAEKALRAFRDSTDEIVRSAADAALLRIECIRSIRAVIARDPGYLIWHLPESDLAKWKEGIDYYLACARAKTDPFRGMTSGVRTVRSPTDGQLLFYVFRLPKDYDPAKRYPMFVSLHAGAGLTWKAGWVDGKPSANPAQTEKAPQIWMSPCGRGNNCYAGMGEVAVMDAIRDIQRHYPVDADRILIGGASMGGTGGFRLGALYPDVFAAAFSLTGGANYSLPVGNGRFDATLLTDNFCNTGLCIWDAPKEGWYAQNHAFADALRDKARKYPGYYPHLELTDPNGSHGVIDNKLQDEGWQWLRKQTRDPYPKRVVYKTYSLRYDGAYWAYLDTVEDAAAPARIEAALDSGKLTVAVENAGRFHLNLVKELVGDAKEVSVSINGPSALKVPTGGPAYFARTDGHWEAVKERYPKGLIKKHGLSGPVLDVFMGGPVLMVHGSAAKPAGDMAERLFGPSDGAAVLHTAFEQKADRDVSEQDIAGKHLVLIGTPRQNELVRRIADRLPIKFLDEGIEAAGKTYTGKDVGVILVYPNPLNPERYVLLLPEDYAGGSPLTYPDYVIVRTVKNGGGAAQQVLAQGVFDSRWR